MQLASPAAPQVVADTVRSHTPLKGLGSLNVLKSKAVELALASKLRGAEVLDPMIVLGLDAAEVSAPADPSGITPEKRRHRRRRKGACAAEIVVSVAHSAWRVSGTPRQGCVRVLVLDAEAHPARQLLYVAAEDLDGVVLELREELSEQGRTAGQSAPRRRPAPAGSLEGWFNCASATWHCGGLRRVVPRTRPDGAPLSLEDYEVGKADAIRILRIEAAGSEAVA
ncbi:MAG: hypothetical protein GY772_24140 [bacterium]|nr:hypothetical protein [bacterium]